MDKAEAFRDVCSRRKKKMGRFGDIYGRYVLPPGVHNGLVGIRCCTDFSLSVCMCVLTGVTALGSRCCR